MPKLAKSSEYKFLQAFSWKKMIFSVFPRYVENTNELASQMRSNWDRKSEVHDLAKYKKIRTWTLLKK